MKRSTIKVIPLDINDLRSSFWYPSRTSFLAEKVSTETKIIPREQGPTNKPSEVRLPSLGSLLFAESFLRNLASRFLAIFLTYFWSGIHFSAL